MSNEQDNLRADIDGIDDLKPGEGIQVGDTKYEYGANLESDKAIIMDSGEGKKVVIRTFEFKKNPQVNLKNVDKQALFTAHSKEIQTFLWADGLRPLEEVAPRVILNKTGYKIYVPCEGRLGAVFIDTPQNLSQNLANELSNKKEKLDTPTL